MELCVDLGDYKAVLYRQEDGSWVAEVRKLGFFKSRQTGGHEGWNHPDGHAVTIPLHGGREIGPPLSLRSFANSASRTTSFSSPANPACAGIRCSSTAPAR